MIGGEMDPASRAMFRWARLLSKPSLNSEPWSTVMDLGLPVDRMWLRMCLFAVCAVRSLLGKALILDVAPSTMIRTLLNPHVELGSYAQPITKFLHGK